MDADGIGVMCMKIPITGKQGIYLRSGGAFRVVGFSGEERDAGCKHLHRVQEHHATWTVG